MEAIHAKHLSLSHSWLDEAMAAKMFVASIQAETEQRHRGTPLS
jgi:hypothetical protein